MSENSQKKLALIILDGWGHYKAYPGNAISLANTPTWDKMWAENPRALLTCSGEAVGLPTGQMGNSEINHAAIGSGRVIYQDLVKLNKMAIEKKLQQSPAIKEAFGKAKNNSTALHIMGLLSPGGVHSHQDHIFALIKEAAAFGVEKIYVHAMTDGRDTAPQSCLASFEKLDKICQETGAELASISGRYYAMDRDHNWERTDLAYQAIKDRQAPQFVNAKEAIEHSYNNGKGDEFIVPCTIKVRNEEEAKVKSGDSLIFANFRNDRPRQLTERFLENGPQDIFFVTMTLYSDKYPVAVAFGPEKIEQTLGEVLAENKIKQLRVTETEKFAHLTFFLNCKREEPYPLEERYMFDSNKVENHAEKPAMRALEIAEKVAEAMIEGQHSVIFANICNGDMVGHTGDIQAAIKAVETVDQSLEKIWQTAKEEQYSLIVTADHGNCEQMLNEDGSVVTEHSTNPVPFVLLNDGLLTRKEGIMADIAPTILKLLHLPQPKEMTGQSLV
ncbi:MAG: 2,3-bisphosphoglycerate-independent phosphoglycerate mutase [Candidatus Pacebacteria bacterium]|jgi:2,3-bisphosphoglycerate-independent phosphoglycerate mutase|nr:2,3-bisphosphoglycerate-independent phosphoglycerate mutase [Candidatus Paceibacterota bacterium]